MKGDPWVVMERSPQDIHQKIIDHHSQIGAKGAMILDLLLSTLSQHYEIRWLVVYDNDLDMNWHERPFAFSLALVPKDPNDKRLHPYMGLGVYHSETQEPELHIDFGIGADDPQLNWSAAQLRDLPAPEILTATLRFIRQAPGTQE